MSKEEEKLLLKIDDLHSKLIESSENSFTSKPNGYIYTRNAKNLKDAIIELHNKFQPDFLSSQIFYRVTDVCNNEVLDKVERLYDVATKKNASKKSNSNFLKSMGKINIQFDLILIDIKAKIKELKKNNKQL